MFQTGTGYVFKFSDFKKMQGFTKLPGLLYSDDILFLHLIKKSYLATTNKKLCFVTLRKSSESGINIKKVDNFINTLKYYNNEVRMMLNKNEYIFLQNYINCFNLHAFKKIFVLSLMYCEKNKIKFDKKKFEKKLKYFKLNYQLVIKSSILIRLVSFLYKLKLLKPMLNIYLKLK